MAIARPLITILSLIILAVGILFQFFVILSGAVPGTPENKVYFLRADTSSIAGAPTQAAWTYFAVCNYVGSSTTACGKTTAAPPFRFSSNFGSGKTYPAGSDTSKLYYMSRAAWAFYLIALFFAVIALFTSLLALCTRLGAYLTGFTTFLALTFQALAAALMTAWTVIGRNNLRKSGIAAHLGVYGYGFSWASVLAFFISMVMFCAAGGVSKRKDKHRTSRNSSTTVPVSTVPVTRTSRFGRARFGPKPVVISEVENGGVKSEYV